MKALEGYVAIVFVVAVLVATYVQGVLGAVGNRVRGLRTRRRARRAELAAVEASLDDPAFEPARVREEVAAIVGLQEAYRNARDPAVFGGRADRDELLEWAGRARGWFGAGGGFGDVLAARILGVVNREGIEQDSVEVWVRIAVRGPLLTVPDSVRRSLTSKDGVLEERWTLGRRDAGWGLLAASADPRSGVVASRPLIANAWDDEEQLRGESLREIAAREPPVPSGLTDQALTPDLQLRDLAVADDRFSPLVIEAVIDRLLEAWEDASRGREARLAALAQAEAAHDLLHPARFAAATMIVRDVRRTGWETMSIHAGAVVVRVQLTALRYLIDSDTRAHVAGAAQLRHEIAVEWQLRLVEDDDPLWQLETTSDPSAEIPGP